MKFYPIFIVLWLFKITLTYANAICPKSLKPGDTVGLIASSSTVENKDEIWKAKANLESMGFKVILGKHIFDDFNDSPTEKSLANRNDSFKTEYANIHINLAGSDEARAMDLMSMFKNHSVKAIIEFRGGYGSARLLHLLNYKLIKHNPKIIMGYSDITALLLAINSQTELVTFHGPMAKESWDEFTKTYFSKALMKNSNGLVLSEYYPVIDESKNISNLRFTINSGVASGRYWAVTYLY